MWGGDGRGLIAVRPRKGDALMFFKCSSLGPCVPFTRSPGISGGPEGVARELPHTQGHQVDGHKVDPQQDLHG